MITASPEPEYSSAILGFVAVFMNEKVIGSMIYPIENDFIVVSFANLNETV
jgi:hypothetical protein